ncbi:MAG: tRNA (adenosine(37)-N6)-threonylcarbamoyltransferase complex ATPase subunit type 1 TsaE [Deltaproteobacteria bacterium]|nr:tRNA (adenosine(37)-N6)-threonylcarbamoyltransferase complex ATPase subunit type 1 TsaE [Deltaproteobacteria bacterium]
MLRWSFRSAGEAQTLDLGIQLGRLLKQSALILLQGELGAGKSVLARGIARGLGVDPRVPITSPTYTLMNHYPARLDLYHFDLYRLRDPDELLEIGFDDFAFGAGATLVEWPERLENDATPGLWVRIDNLKDDLRELTFLPRGEAAEELLLHLRRALSS